MTPADTIFAMLQAEIATGKATKRSLGTIYAMAIGFMPVTATERWRPFNDAIRASRANVSNDFRYLSQVKKIGWDIYNAVVAAQLTPSVQS